LFLLGELVDFPDHVVCFGAGSSRVDTPPFRLAGCSFSTVAHCAGGGAFVNLWNAVDALAFK
jgi:hypothetical protein